MFDTIIRILAQVLIFIIFVDALLSWFMHPEQPVRRTLDNLVNPMLEPIRRLLPQNMGWDLSPLVLIVMIEIIQVLLIGLF